MKAVNFPCEFAPMATRCCEGVRPPTIRNTPSRDKARRTGRPVIRAARTQSWLCAHVPPLPPNPPPTNGEMTRTFSRFRSRRASRKLRGIVQGKFVVFIPYSDAGVWFNGIVVVRRCGEFEIDLVI